MKSSEFAMAAVQERSVWTLRGGEGYAAVATHDGRRIQPFWSRRSFVDEFLSLSPNFVGYLPHKCSIEEFELEWLPKLHRGGMLVGLDWSGASATGSDAAPPVVHRLLHVASAEAAATPGARPPIADSFRKLVAAWEMLGGAAMMVLLAALFIQGVVIAPWYFPLVLGLGLAGVVFGLWLWLNEHRGWRLSRGYQALQLIALQTPSFAGGILAGLFVQVSISTTNIGVSAGFSGSVLAATGESMPWEIRINLLATAALMALAWPHTFRRVFDRYSTPAWALPRHAHRGLGRKPSA